VDSVTDRDRQMTASCQDLQGTGTVGSGGQMTPKNLRGVKRGILTSTPDLLERNIFWYTGQLTLSKIIQIVATSCQLLKCIKFDFGWGSAPDPAGGAYSAPPDSPSWI